jgi:HTH-type transcriptional regulator/antitoxin HipB
MSTTHPPSQWRASNATEFGKALARVRRHSGLTQEQLAVRAGISRTYLAKMEAGLSTEQIQRMFAILRDLGYELALVPRGEPVAG